MIGLDAAEPSLIERWMSDGSLPNLKRLRDRGGYGRLASTADWLSGSPWPTFYTGTSPADHGLYHYLQWRADKMVHVRPSPDWLPLRPFWRLLGEGTRRAVAFDIPMTFSPEPFNGIEVSGWATHDQLAPPASYPQSMMGWIRRRFGRPPMSEEFGGLQSLESLLRLRDELIQATRCAADVAQALMSRETWDLFVCGFGATHRGGHKLWDTTNVLGDVRSEEEEGFSRALRDVYIACDEAIGRLVEVAGGGVTILVFSLHGMGPNTSRADLLLPRMLERILSKEADSRKEPERDGYLQRLRKLVPLGLRHRVRRRLPSRLQDRLTAFWRMGGIDWNVTPAATLIADLQGYIRINLRGREVNGIVEPGEEYDGLCAGIIEGLYTFVDADTGEPVVEDVIRSDRLFMQGVRLNNLPDLIVRWATSPAANHRAIVSPRYGSIPWPMPGRNPDGRSGNHNPKGFLIVVGNRIKPGSQIRNAHILDLAPTVYALLDLPKPTEMCGNALSIIQPD